MVFADARLIERGRVDAAPVRRPAAAEFAAAGESATITGVAAESAERSPAAIPATSESATREPTAAVKSAAAVESAATAAQRRFAGSQEDDQCQQRETVSYLFVLISLLLLNGGGGLTRESRRCGGFRTMTISSMFGSTSSPTTRSRDCQVMRSFDTRVVTLVADATLPSRRVPVSLTIQRLPFRVQTPSAIAALGVENPGVDLLRRRIPANPLRAGHGGSAANLDLELAEDGAAAGVPTIRRNDDRGRTFVDPLANQPFELPELVAARVLFVVQVACAGHSPAAVLLDVDDHVAVVLGALARGCS